MWKKKLKGCFISRFLVHGSCYNPFMALSLLPRSQWKVRRTLAFSIHELAVILGDQLTAADLVPIFNGFLKDLDEVRIGVLKHLYDFLKVRLQVHLLLDQVRYNFGSAVLTFTLLKCFVFTAL